MVLKELKSEAMNLIELHSTLSSLRRACSKGTCRVVEATDTMPRLYYVMSNGVESIHALSTDMTKFLMLSHIEESGAGAEYLLKSVEAHWIKSEEDYNKYVDADYRKQYPWNESKATMPWLVINVVKSGTSTESTVSEAEDESEEPSASKVKVTIKFDSSVILGSTVDSVGTVSEDRRSIEMDIDKYLMLEAVNDMGLTGAAPIKVSVETEDAIYNMEVR